MSCKEQKVYPPLSPYEKKSPYLRAFFLYIFFIIYYY